MPLAMLGGGVAALIAASLALLRVAKQRAIRDLRASWAKPSARDRDMDAIAEYSRFLVSAGSRTLLDARTCADLDLESVFARLDRTSSSLGQQSLYARLRSTPVAPHLDAFEQLVTRFESDTDARERAQLALIRLKGTAGYDMHRLTQPGAVPRHGWHIAFPFLAALMVGLVVASAIQPGFLLLLFAITVVNILIRTAMARETRDVVRAFRLVRPLVETAEACAFLSDGPGAPLIGTLRDDGQALRRLKRIGRWVSRDPTPAVVGDLVGTALEYVNLLFLVDLNAIYFAAGELKERGPQLLRVIAAIGEVDAAIAIASWRVETTNWTRPSFRAPREVLVTREAAVMTDLRHPLVHDAVPNSIALAPPHGVLVTGSNMSGKSTFLRTLGVNAVMAQTINTCVASRYEAPVFHVRSCMGNTDDLLQGKSYYLAEVESVLGLVHASDQATPHLFLLDELFRGTNAVERIAAAEAVLTHLTHWTNVTGATGVSKPHVVVIATHDAELVDLLSDSYVPCHFEDSLGPNGLMFEYRLKTGPATSRNAIQLLELQGAPDTLVKQALARAEVLDTQRRVKHGAGIGTTAGNES